MAPNFINPNLAFSRCRSRRIKFQILVKFRLKFRQTLLSVLDIFLQKDSHARKLQRAKTAEIMLINAARVDICAKFRDIGPCDRRMAVDVKNAFVLAKIASAAKHVPPKLRRAIAVRVTQRPHPPNRRMRHDEPPTLRAFKLVKLQIKRQI